VRFLIILFSILVAGLNAAGQDELLSGLYFSSHEVIPDNRTSLNLTPSGPFRFPDGFTIEMNANFRNGDGYFGYIFRIIGDQNTNIDLVSRQFSTPNFYLVLKDKVLITFNWKDIPDGGFNKWIKIKFSINTRESKIAVTFNGKKQESIIAGITGLRNFNVVFGACRINSFLNTDVAQMALKDIRILDAKSKVVNEWKLSKHAQNLVYDEIKHAEALVENPIWNIDSHVKWRKIKELKIDSLHGIAKDEATGRAFFVDNHAVYIFSTKTSKIDTIEVVSGSPSSVMGTQILYNKSTDELWSYSFTQNAVSKFSFKTKTWSFNQKSYAEPDFWHHNKFFSPIDSSLITLFGYGHYTYKSIIHRYAKNLNQWQIIDRFGQIEPRYLSSCGFLNNKEMLVFGGYGSKSGRQELSPEFYYDLYSLNLTDYSFKKLWTLDPPEKPFVPCEALIPDQQEGIFYTLLYNRINYASSLRLAKFGIEKNGYQLFNDSIPYNFLDTKSWCTLFLDQKTTQLVAITTHNSQVSLYSMAYPPLLPENVYQLVPFHTRWYFWIIGGLFVISIISISYIFIKKRKNRDNKKRLYELVEHPNIAAIEPIDRKTVSSIFFMGGFQIYDSKGRNITSAFSPTLKHLFLFIFLHTIKNEKGISSAKLDEVLWFDKSGDSARNNRNVNISKLRSILEDLGGVEVVNDNSFWKIQMDPTIFCDYCEALRLLRKANSSGLGEIEINQLIALLSFGELLPAIQTDWMDEFKSRFANETIDGLSSLFNLKEVRTNISLRYHLAECILVYDPLNDEAFAVKCSVLYNLGKKGMAKNLYDSFCKEYKNALGIDYAILFNDTIK
jgi:two-component SAPR family response regulator